MYKFKPGDVVSSDVYGAAWKDSEVIEFNRDGYYEDWYKVKNKKGEFGLIMSDHLYLSNPTSSPIRVTTRKEIVAGTYGIVKVFEDETLIISPVHTPHTPEELREAAHTLNQIAEYLESKGK